MKTKLLIVSLLISSMLFGYSGKVFADSPDKELLVMTTSLEAGSNISFKIGSSASKQLSIDFGNGVLKNLSVDGNIQTINEIVGEDQTIKIYGDPSAIDYLNASGIGLTELNVSQLPELRTLLCSSNNLQKLELKANSKIETLDVSNNNFTLSTLPIAEKGTNWIYKYAPQKPMKTRDFFYLDELIDFNSEYSIADNITTYAWKRIVDGDTVNITGSTHLNMSKGRFMFINTYDSTFCEMQNPLFPDLVGDKAFKTIYMKSAAYGSSFWMGSHLDEGKEFTFYAKASEPIAVKVDFGNGVFNDVTIGTNLTKISGVYLREVGGGNGGATIHGDVAKITELYIDSLNLYQINVQKLSQLKILSCSYNVQANFPATDLQYLEYLNAERNGISSSYDKIQTLPKLKYLNISLNYLENAIDLSKNTELETLIADNNKIPSVILPREGNLKKISLEKNQLTNLDLPNYSNLEYLNLKSNKFTVGTLPLKSENATWEYTYAPQQKMRIGNVLIPNREFDLKYMASVGGQATSFVWKKADGSLLNPTTDYTANNGVFNFVTTQADSIYCEISNPLFPLLKDDNAFTTTSASVESLELNTRNKFSIHTDLPVGASVATRVKLMVQSVLNVDFGDGSIRKYDPKANESLVLNISGVLGAKQEITVYPNTNKIETLSLPNQEVTTIDVSNLSPLENLYVSGNKLTSLNLTNNSALKILDVQSNQLEELDVTDSYYLVKLICNSNQLKTIDLKKQWDLQTLEIKDNNLEKLDLSKNTALTYITCYNNKLKELDLSKNKALTTMYLSNNNISKLVLPEFTNRVSSLNFSNNNLTFETLPDIASINSITACVYAPQNQIQIVEEVPLNTAVDLSNQEKIDSYTTSYQWQTSEGEILSEGNDYKIENGVTTFIKEPQSEVYCTLYNDAFPRFSNENILKTTLLKVKNSQSGINNPQADDLITYFKSGNIVVESETNGIVKVFNTSGVQCLTATIVAGKTEIPFNSIGIFIITFQSGNKLLTTKITAY